MAAKIITLTTDFGTGSPYVAEMKASVLSINRDAVVVDITHAIRPQDVRQAALVLETVTPRFPTGTIHLGVIDPGVGSDRALVCARIADHDYVVPDNGLLSLVTRRCPPQQVVKLQDTNYWNPSVANTFHGRDIMAPVAAHLSRGVPPSLLGPPHAQLVDLPWPEPERRGDLILGTVLHIDTFGNLITNLQQSDLQNMDPAAWEVSCCGQTCRAWVACYAEAAPQTLVALFGSSNRLEIAVTNGNAAQQLEAHDGDAVHLRPRGSPT
jgi:S-adenosylmethionine hydrolase